MPEANFLSANYGLTLPIIGEQVIIRRIEEHDLNDFYSLESDCDVKQFIGGPVSKSRQEWITGMRDRLNSTLALAIETQSDNSFAGCASIGDFIYPPQYADTANKDIQIIIAKHYWGQGFGKEIARMLIDASFDELCAERVIAVIHPDNNKSQSLFKKIGFTQIGEISSKSWQRHHGIWEISRLTWQLNARG